MGQCATSCDKKVPLEVCLSTLPHVQQQPTKKNLSAVHQMTRRDAAPALLRQFVPYRCRRYRSLALRNAIGHERRAQRAARQAPAHGAADPGRAGGEDAEAGGLTWAEEATGEVGRKRRFKEGGHSRAYSKPLKRPFKDCYRIASVVLYRLMNLLILMQL